MNAFAIKLFEAYIPCFLIDPNIMIESLTLKNETIPHDVKVQFFRYFFEDFKKVSYDLQTIYEERYKLKGYHLFFKYFTNDKDEFDKLLDHLTTYMRDLPSYNIVVDCTDKKLEEIAPEDRENIRNIIKNNLNIINNIRDYYRQKLGTEKYYFIFEKCILDKNTYDLVEECFQQIKHV